MIAAPLKTLASLLLLGGLIYLVLLLYVYLNQTNLIHLPNLPSRLVSATPERIGLAYEKVELRTQDGLTLEGWFLPAAATAWDAALPAWQCRQYLPPARFPAAVSPAGTCGLHLRLSGLRQ